MTKVEKLKRSFEYREMQKSHNQITFSKEEIREFFLDVLFEFEILKEVLQKYNLKTSVKSNPNTFSFIVEDGKNVFSFNIIINNKLRQIINSFDYNLRFGDQIKSFRVYDRPVDLSRFKEINSDWIVEKFHYLYFLRDYFGIFFCVTESENIAKDTVVSFIINPCNELCLETTSLKMEISYHL